MNIHSFTKFGTVDLSMQNFVNIYPPYSLSFDITIEINVSFDVDRQNEINVQSGLGAKNNLVG